MFTFVVLSCIALFGASMQECTLTTENFMVEEYAVTHLFCADLDKALIEDFEICAENDPPEFKNAYNHCFEVADVGNKRFYEILTAFCTKETTRQIYLGCIRTYAIRPDFLKAVFDGYAATEACYDTIWPKHGRTKEEMADLYFRCTETHLWQENTRFFKV